MFRPTGELAESIFRDRYALFPEETWSEACERVASHVARAESGVLPLNTQSHALNVRDASYRELVSGRFMPAGRIWYGSGRRQGQLLNCFVIPSEDSIEGWAKVVSDVMIISSRGGGVGVALTPIRGRGARIAGTGGFSTGSVSLMQAVNNVGEILVGGGGRRMALMLALGITHPDVEEFLSVKLDHKQLNNANISLILDMDPLEFQRKVRNNEQLDLEFNGHKIGKTVDARALWEKLVYNAWSSGEPGILNGWLAQQENNISYYADLICTNPCGEIWLEKYGCCDLGALVLHRFVKDGAMDWEQLGRTIKVAVRFLDNVLTVNNYPLPEIEQNCKQVRRIGLGVMGLHNMLLALGMRYSSPRAVEFIDELFGFIKLQAYIASIDLAVEKESFPAWKPEMADSGFASRLPESLRHLIRTVGIRNCALLTIAPTGTTALVQGCSSGIEPLYAPVHYRNYWSPTADGSKVNHRTLVVDPAFQEYGDLVEGALDLEPRQHFEIQRTVQRHIDNAVSKTINLPADYTVEDLADVWLEYLPFCKGTTLYRSGSRGQEPLEYVPHDQIESVLRREGYVVELDLEFQNAMDCVGGACSIDSRPVTAGKAG